MRTCLVVDDSRIVRAVASRIIRDMEFEVVEAGDGMQALQSCREKMPDAILLDWTMPVMNGLDFLRALRREQGGRAPKVVFCSTENDADHIGEAVRSGADEFVMKPFDSTIIRSKFAEVGLI